MKKTLKAKDKILARVFVLIPTQSDNAIVLRRGPSASVGIFSWNMKSDTIQNSQWLKGRIYEYWSDISSDGKYFLYSANKKGFGYTAISYAPWIKAISLWHNGGFRGGGIFLNNKKYMLYDLNYLYNEFTCKDLKGVNRSNHEELNFGIYHDRLLRADWLFKLSEENIHVYTKKIQNHLELEKVYNTSESTEYHRLIDNNGVVEKPSWRWCECRDQILYWSEHGCLYKAIIETNGEIGNPSLIYNFEPEVFVNKVAPYERV